MFVYDVKPLRIVNYTYINQLLQRMHHLRRTAAFRYVPYIYVHEGWGSLAVMIKAYFEQLAEIIISSCT